MWYYNQLIFLCGEIETSEIDDEKDESAIIKSVN